MAFPDFLRNSTAAWWKREIGELYTNPREPRKSLKFDGLWIVSASLVVCLWKRQHYKPGEAIPGLAKQGARNEREGASPEFIARTTRTSAGSRRDILSGGSRRPWRGVPPLERRPKKKAADTLVSLISHPPLWCHCLPLATPTQKAAIGEPGSHSVTPGRAPC